MNKRLFFILASVLYLQAHSQNVGIGTNAPSQKLDVAGNINTSGNLMVNGVSGNNGQILAMNGGNMQWMDKSRFQNWAIFTFTGASTFTVPAGVSEVMIDMWGAGGGGHLPGGGGGGGGFWSGIIPVTAGAVINITVGAGGAPGINNTLAGDGGNTSFSVAGFNVITGGGTGADTAFISAQETFSSGNGGSGLVSITAPAGFRNYYFVTGQDGVPTTITYTEVASGVFAKTTIFGTGGLSPLSNSQAPVPTSATNSTTATQAYFTRKRSGLIPNFGCGGSVNSTGGAQIGGSGRMIIYY